MTSNAGKKAIGDDGVGVYAHKFGKEFTAIGKSHSKARTKATGEFRDYVEAPGGVRFFSQ